MLEDSERKKQFDSLFYQIVDVTHRVDGFDREKYKEVMKVYEKLYFDLKETFDMCAAEQ